jgi:hypothetical protein
MTTLPTDDELDDTRGASHNLRSVSIAPDFTRHTVGDETQWKRIAALPYRNKEAMHIL